MAFVHMRIVIELLLHWVRFIRIIDRAAYMSVLPQTCRRSRINKNFLHFYI